MPSFNQSTAQQSRINQQQSNLKNFLIKSNQAPIKKNKLFQEITFNASSLGNLTFKSINSSIISPSSYQTNDDPESEVSKNSNFQNKTKTLSQNQILNELSESNPIYLIFGNTNHFKFIEQGLTSVSNNIFQTIFEIENIGKQFLNYQLKTFDQKQQLQIDQILVLYFLFGFVINYGMGQDSQLVATIYKQFIAMVALGFQIFTIWVLEHTISMVMLSMQIIIHVMMHGTQSVDYFSQTITNLLPFFILLLLCCLNETIIYYQTVTQEFSKLIYLVLNEKFENQINQFLIKCKIQEKRSDCIFLEKLNGKKQFDQFYKTADKKIQKTSSQYVKLLKSKDSLQNLLSNSSQFTTQQNKEVIETINQQNEIFKSVKKEIDTDGQKIQLQSINLGSILGTYFIIFKDEKAKESNTLNLEFNITDIHIKPVKSPKKPEVQQIIKIKSHQQKQENDIFSQTFKLQRDDNVSQKTPSLNLQSSNNSMTMYDISKNFIDPALLDSNNIDQLYNSSPKQKDSILNHSIDSPFKDKEEQTFQEDAKIEKFCVKEPVNQIEFLRQELKKKAQNANNLRFNMLENIIESNDEESKQGVPSIKSIQSQLSISASGEFSQGFHLSQKMPDASDQTDASLSGDDTHLQGIENMQIEIMSSKVNLENGITKAKRKYTSESDKGTLQNVPQVLPKSQFSNQSSFEQDYSFSRDGTKDVGKQNKNTQQEQNRNNFKQFQTSKFYKDVEEQQIQEVSRDSVSSVAGNNIHYGNLENNQSSHTFDLLNSTISLLNLAEIQSHQSNVFIRDQNEDEQSPRQTEQSQICQIFQSKKSSQEKTISAFSNLQRINNLMDDEYDAVSCYTRYNQLGDFGPVHASSELKKRRQSIGLSEHIQNIQSDSSLQVNHHISARLRRNSVKVVKDFHIQVPFSKLEAIRQERNELQNKIKTLQKQLNNNKIFLNMVIHDMRSPSTSAEFGLMQCLQTILQVQKEKKSEVELGFSKKLQDYCSVIINAFTKFEEQKLQKRQFTPLVTKNQDSNTERQLLPFRPTSGLSGASYNLSFRSQSPSPVFEKPQIDQRFKLVKHQASSMVDQRFENKNLHIRSNVFTKFKIQQNRSDDSSVSLDRVVLRSNSGMSLVNSYNISTFLDFQFQIPQSLVVRPFGPQSIEDAMKSQLLEQKQSKIKKILDNWTQTSDQNNLQIIDYKDSSLKSEILETLNLIIDEFALNQQKQIEKKQQENQQIESYFQILEKNSHYALHSIQLNLNLINDLLDLAKLENNQFSLNQEFFSIVNVIEQAFETMKFQANLKKVDLELVFPDEQTSQKIQQFLLAKKNDNQTESEFLLRTSQMAKNQKEKWNKKLIFGDSRRYLQILLNFLSNALKFTNKEGWIKVHLGILEQQEEIMRRNSFDDLDSEQDNEIQSNSELRRSITINAIQSQKTKKNFDELFVKFYIMIEDSGVGISQKNIKNLFLNFGKLEEHDSMNAAGTGLGLSICKQLIEQMAGEVFVESKPNVGTAFILVFTSKKRQINDEPNSQSYTSTQIRKRIAQEYAQNSKTSSFFTLQKTLKIQDQQSNKSNGSKALTQQQFSETKMSEMAKKKWTESLIRKSGSTNERVLKVSLSNNQKQLSQFSQSILVGLSDSGDSQNSNKKEDLQKVTQYLENSLKKGSNEISLDIQQNKQKLINSMQISNKKKYKVLVVNDNIMQLMCSKIILEEYCYEIVEAQNGYEAYQIIKNTYFSLEKKKTLLFDFVLMDLDMPIMNGWQACKNIRSLLNDDHSLFKVSNNSQESQYQHKEYRLDTSNSNDLRDFVNSSVTSKKNNLYIFAYSSLITQEIELKALQAGFNKCIDAPLQAPTLKKEIIEFIEADRLLRRNKDNSLAQFDDISSLYSLNNDDKQSRHAFSTYSRYRGQVMRKNDATTSMMNIPNTRWSPQEKDDLSSVTRGLQKLQNSSRLNEGEYKNFSLKVQVSNQIQDEKNTFISQDSIPRIMTKNEELSSQILDNNQPMGFAGRNFVRRQSLFAQNVRQLDLLNPNQEQFKSFKEDESPILQSKPPKIPQEFNKQRKNSQPQMFSGFNRQDSGQLEEISSNNSQMGYAIEEKPIEEDQRLEFGRLLLPNRQRQRLIQDFKRDFIDFK